jgi:DNA-directed RNA polymerase specialized sigma24 family protein
VAEHETMTTEANYEQERARRFGDDALLHLGDAFTLARYLLRDAEDAVQECYLRAQRHFESYDGPAMKPWLLAIVTNVCLPNLRGLRSRKYRLTFLRLTRGQSRSRYGRRIRPHRRRRSSDSRTTTRSAGSSPHYRTRFEKPVCRIRKSPKSPRCPWER